MCIIKMVWHTKDEVDIITEGTKYEGKDHSGITMR
jgi:hypothetical protein